MDLTTQEWKDTLSTDGPCEQCNKVQLTFSLFFSLSFLALLPLCLFSIPIIVPHSSMSHLSDLSLRHKIPQELASGQQGKPPPKKLQFSCTARTQHKVYVLPLNTTNTCNYNSVSCIQQWSIAFAHQESR